VQDVAGHSGPSNASRVDVRCLHGRSDPSAWQAAATL